MIRRYPLREAVRPAEIMVVLYRRVNDHRVDHRAIVWQVLAGKAQTKLRHCAGVGQIPTAEVTSDLYGFQGFLIVIVPV